jgi:hypothetical protein
MSIKIPQNQVVTKYTSGREYVIEKTNAPYKGFYCEVNGKAYTGKEYISSGVSGSLPLIKITSENYNKLLLNPKTALYGILSGVKLNSNPNIPSVNRLEDFSPMKYYPESETYYYCKKVNDNVIKEINKDTYNKINKDPLYITISIKPGFTDMDKANKQMPGIKDFIERPSLDSPDIIIFPGEENLNIVY